MSALVWRRYESPSHRFAGTAKGGRSLWLVSFPAPTVLGDLQRQVNQAAYEQRHGLACVVRGTETTSVRMAKKLAGWDF